MKENIILYYGHDPMCSFCWAFSPVWREVRALLTANHPEITLVNLMGGLAPDSDEPMSPEMSEKIQRIWRYIQERFPATRFNFDFWRTQQPRRATYPACRAVMAAKMLRPDLEETMIQAIQEAYYLNSENPSNEETLIRCAESAGLEKQEFTRMLRNPECDQNFAGQRHQSLALGISAFPSLVIAKGKRRLHIPVDFLDPQALTRKIVETAALL